MLTTRPVSDYRAELLSFLNIEEGFRDGLPYIDIPVKPEIATIGYGFNIETDSSNMALVLNRLGIFADKSEAQIQEILGQFIVAATANHTTTTLRSALNALAQQNGVAEFSLTVPEATTIYTQILTGATIPVTSGQPIVIQGKEARLDARIQNSVPHNSLEYEALMSLFYNGESLIKAGSKLANAVIHGDRAEAWYQIRYNKNTFKNDPDPTKGANGIANRRIAESNLFSLYNNPGQAVGEVEAKNVLRMYTTHRAEIRDYELLFPTIFPTGGAATIDPQLTNARGPLIAVFGQGRTIDGEVLVGQDVATGIGDTLLGSLTVRNDLLFGEKGNDWLFGVQRGEKVSGTFLLTEPCPRGRMRRDGTSVAGRRGRRALSCAQPGEWPAAAV